MTPAPAPPEPDQGHYAARHRRAFFLAWSHGARFRRARRLVAPFAGRRLLDYGCGDGTFLGQVRDLFPDAVGADTAAEQVADCGRRFAAYPGLRFVSCGDLANPVHAAAYDVLTCMEVLEHCPAPAVDVVLDDLARLAAPGATIIFSVPVEVGPSLIAKLALRRVAGWMGIGEYRQGERYCLRELATMVFAGHRTQIDRPVYTAAPDGSGGYHGHKGFNWKALHSRVAARFRIKRVTFSPLGWLGSLANSQVWFVCGRPN